MVNRLILFMLIRLGWEISVSLIDLTFSPIYFEMLLSLFSAGKIWSFVANPDFLPWFRLEAAPQSQGLGGSLVLLSYGWPALLQTVREELAMGTRWETAFKAGQVFCDHLRASYSCKGNPARRPGSCIQWVKPEVKWHAQGYLGCWCWNLCWDQVLWHLLLL